MNEQERVIALQRMKAASDQFYYAATQIGVHPFIEFTGLMNEYIKACSLAHDGGVDFSRCNTHTGQELPLKPFMVRYINEKLECIFTGRSVLSNEAAMAEASEPT